MRAEKIATIIDLTLRCSAGIAVLALTGIAGVFGLILVATPQAEDRLVTALVLVVGGTLAVLFFLTAIATDTVARRAPGPTRIWSLALRVIIYPAGLIGGCWLVWQYVTVNL